MLKKSKYVVNNKDSSEESNHKESQFFSSSEYESNNFSNNNIDSDDEPDWKKSSAQLQKSNQSQSPNNSPQIIFTKMRGVNRKPSSKVSEQKILSIFMITR